MEGVVQLLAGAMVVFCAGVVQGCTGFGLGLVASPMLMLLIPPVAVVPTVILMSTCNSFLVVMDARRHVQLRLVAPLVLGGVTGMPLGVYALANADPGLLKSCLGVIVVAFSALMLSGWRRPLRNEQRALIPVGIASGLLGGGAAIGGPPIIFFLTNQAASKDVFRANLVCYFFTMSWLGLGLYLYHGLLTLEVGKFSLAFLPALLAGTYGGVRLSRRLPEDTFKKAAMLVVMATGALLIVVNVRAYLGGM